MQRHHHWLIALTLVLADLLALAACSGMAWQVKHVSDPNLPTMLYLSAVPALAALWIAVMCIVNLYPAIGLSLAEELRRCSIGVTVFAALVMSYTFVSQTGELWSRQIVLTTWFGMLLTVPVLRTLARRACCRCAWWGVPTVVLGAGATGRRVVALLTERPWLGLRPTLLLDDDPAKIGTVVLGVPVAGPISDLPKVAGRVGCGVLAMPGLAQERLSEVLDAATHSLRQVYIAPALPGCPEIVAETREFAYTLAFEIRQNLLLPHARIIKRGIDILAAAGAFLLCWWLFLAVAVAVRLSSPGPILYGQRRIGYLGRPFTAWKFRTMVADADRILQDHLAAHPEARAEWEATQKLKDDPRVTPLGRCLRRASLDELPQFWNILRGDMSLIGPRPIVEAEIPKYGRLFALYSKVRPGLSGLWQVSGRNDTSYAERVALDSYYVRNWSLWLDIVIVAKTVLAVLRGRGAY